MLDPADGLDFGGLAVGAPVLPALIVSTVPLTLHNVLLTPVAWVLIAHKAGGNTRKKQSQRGRGVGMERDRGQRVTEEGVR